MDAPSQSRLFGALSLDCSVLAWPTLNGLWETGGGQRVEVGLVGAAAPRTNWAAFLKKAEKAAIRFLAEEQSILAAAYPAIVEKYRLYFPARNPLSAGDVPAHLLLRLLCFYTDNSMHAWYKGDALFNHLDIDMGLTNTFAVDEVRFDG